VGIVDDLLPHDLSIAMAVFDSEPIRVRALGLESQASTGTVSIEVTFSNQSTLISNLSWKHPKKTRSVSFSGDGLLILFNELAEVGKELTIKYFEEVESSRNLYRYLDEGDEVIDTGSYCIWPESIPMRNQPLAVSLFNFTKAIGQGESVTLSASVGHSIVGVLEQLREIDKGR
jgi:predicted dehydrogenase